jgi:uncharacterized RDD family membrane protein YckC
MTDAAAVSAPVVRDLDRETAGLLRRGIAEWLDSMALSPVTVLVFLPFIQASFAGDASGTSVPWWRWTLGLCVSIAYPVILLTRFGATLGMIALGIRVTTLNGAKIGFRRALARTAAYMVPPIIAGALQRYRPGVSGEMIYGAWAIGLLWIMVDRAHQGFHDKIAGTLVMFTPRRRKPATGEQP